MRIETDGRISFIKTIGITKNPSSVSYTLDQDIFARIVAKIFCVDLESGMMRSFILNAAIQRAGEDSRIAGYTEMSNDIGDVELEGASAKVEVDGATINIRVSGIENLTLTWATQFSIEILKQD